MKKILQIIPAFAIFSCFNLLHAQVAPSIQWEKSFGGSSEDQAYSVEQTADGGFVAVGQTYSGDGDVSGFHGYSDYWVVKLDALGNLEWQKTLGGTKYDNGIFIQQTTDGGYVVAGGSYSNDGDVSGHYHDYDYWVVRLDNAGDIVWQKSLGGFGYDKAYSVQQTSDGGFIVAGVSTSDSDDVSGNHGSYDYWVVKLDTIGNITWQKSLGGSDEDWAYSVQQTADGGFIVAGYSYSNDGDVSGNHGSGDYWIVKLSAVGNIVWQKSLGGSSYEVPYSIQQTADGGFIAAGYSYSTNGEVSGNHDQKDYWIVKLDSIGNLAWQKCLGGSSTDVAYSVQQTTDGGFIVAGYSFSVDGEVSGNHGTYDYWIVKLDPGGNIVWQKCLGGSNYDVAYSIQQTSDGGFIIAGYSYSTDGDVSGNHGNADYWIVKLAGDSVTGVVSPSINTISLYPNPVQSLLKINLTTPANENTIRVFNLEGRTFNLPTSNLQSQTSNSFQFNTESLPDGFYTIQIINNKTGESEATKFVKQQ